MSIPIYRILIDSQDPLGKHVSVFRMTGPYRFDTLVNKEFGSDLEDNLILRIIHHEIKNLRKSCKWPFIKRNLQ